MQYKISLENEMKIRDYLLSLHLGKPKIHDLFQYKLVSINGKIANPFSIIKDNDLLEIIYDEDINYLPFHYKLDILYEDDYLLVINKPVGFMVHPDEINKDKTVCNMIANYYTYNNIKANVRYVHRIDTETSGILIFAKDMLTEAYFNYHFALHDFKREYLALVHQVPLPDKGIIDAKIGSDRHDKQRRRVSKTGVEARTYYEVLKSYNKYSLVKLVLQTGRTHQIRVHMRYLGYPLLGDELYGGSKKYIDRVALHSYRFTYIDPYSLKENSICCPLPMDMKKLLKGEENVIW